MFRYLQIQDPGERAAVAATDAALWLATLPGRAWPRRPRPARPRLLVFRFERIGDLVMARPALTRLRELAPDSHIELAVGGWNRAFAAWLPEVDAITVLDLPWLTRGAAGATFADVRAAVRRWRGTAFDVAINLEGDIRSHLLMRATGVAERVGFDMAGGGPVLTHREPYDPTRHVADNCVRLVERAMGAAPHAGTLRTPVWRAPDAVRGEARAVLAAGGAGPLVGIHPSGGRPIKQWAVERMAETATALARQLDATIVITGAPDERPLAAECRRLLPASVRVIDLAGQLRLDLMAAVLGELDLFVSADTGPMHIAAASGTPTVGIFGPSDPQRWGPVGPYTRVVRVGIWCSPCNRIRTPPARCRGHVPDCLVAVTPDLVVTAGLQVLDEARARGDRHVR